MRINRRLILGCLASVSAVCVAACDNGASVGAVGAPTGTAEPTGSTAAALPEGVPQGAEIGEIADWYGHPVVTYATFEADGTTVKDFGTVLSMASVSNIPPGAFMSYQWLKVPPSVAAQTFIQSYQLDFMPFGHPPAKVYDVPHIDTHAFGWSQEEMSSLTCQGPTDTMVPPSDFIPAGSWDFSPVPGAPPCAPAMGVHGLNVNAPELNGMKFTTSMAVIVARGEFMSYEPKYTIETLQNRKDFEIPLPAPKKGTRATRIPTTLKCTYLPAADAWQVVYTNFVSVGPS